MQAEFRNRFPPLIYTHNLGWCGGITETGLLQRAQTVLFFLSHTCVLQGHRRPVLLLLGSALCVRLLPAFPLPAVRGEGKICLCATLQCLQFDWIQLQGRWMSGSERSADFCVLCRNAGRFLLCLKANQQAKNQAACNLHQPPPFGEMLMVPARRREAVNFLRAGKAHH